MTDICGFFFRNPPNYTPSLGLDAWLSAGAPPVYIGFGSIVVDDPEKLTAIILEAIKISGVRAIISRGWSKLRGEDSTNLFYLNDCPHEWLFQRVAAVVHHGGAGTTACGLLNSRPTAIVPFFGEQVEPVNSGETRLIIPQPIFLGKCGRKIWCGPNAYSLQGINP